MRFKINYLSKNVNNIAFKSLMAVKFYLIFDIYLKYHVIWKIANRRYCRCVWNIL